MISGLEVQGVSHFYGLKSALDGVGFSIEKGTFCALLGPNGAGKSTLFALLTNLFTPSAGDITIAGTNLVKKPTRALAKIGVVFQQPTLDMDLTVRQNLSYAAALHGLSGKSANSRIDQCLEQLEMDQRASEKVRDLNGGHRRRMEIARALLHEPAVLLLDEATVGLDAETRTMITEYAHRIAAEDALTVLWATHLVDEVFPEDQLVILHQGKVIANDLCKNITGNDTLGKTFAQLTAAKSDTETRPT